MGPTAITPRRPHLPRLEPPPHASLDRARIPHPGATTAPATQGGSLTLFGVLRELQALVACWQGVCPTLATRSSRSTASAGPTSPWSSFLGDASRRVDA